MTPRLRSSTRRRVALLVAFACLSGCGQNEGPGKGAFSYACPAPNPADPSAPSLDAACGPDGDGLASLPEVAVSAPFSLRYSEPTTGAPRPAVASRATSTSLGWSLTQPGWLGFIAWSGSDVVDFTHVHAETIATLRLEPDLTAPVSTGTTIHVAATPLGGTGAVLGGAIPCSFVSSNPAVVSVAGAGRVARAFARTAGEVTLSAECLGTGAEVTVQVVGPQPAGATDVCRGLVLIVALGCVLLVALGCGPSPAVTIAPVGQSPAGSLTSGLASVPIGIVLGFEVKADASAVVTAAVDDEALATVAPTTQSTEFVIVGVATGQTTLRVFVNDQEAAELSVQVTSAAP